MRFYFLLFVIASMLVSCENNPDVSKKINHSNSDTLSKTEEQQLPKLDFHIDTPRCDENGCEGSYSGPEFVLERYVEPLHLTGTDIAHNFSNLMAKYVGQKLKALYKEGIYVKVDFSKIVMTSQGMRDGNNRVHYYLKIPFVKVKNKRDAMTGFDHSGGWGHAPDITERKTRLINATPPIVQNKKLFVSPLKKTPEGLEEYWIQWKHTAYQ
jgi:hypothetical protein